MSEYLNLLYSIALLPKDLVVKSASYLMPSCNCKNIAQPAIDLIQISSSPWIKVAGLSGALSVVWGAYGAHGLKTTNEKRHIFETANKYHFYHSIALLSIPFVKRPRMVGFSFLLGISLFSGLCYMDVLVGIEKWKKMVPVGGLFFILGWLSMVF